jgi:DNA invertase Pin-like site-specific DNA recombinase
MLAGHESAGSPGRYSRARRCLAKIGTQGGVHDADLIEIVTSLEACGVGVKSLTNGIVDTTTAHGKLVFGIFALMAEYEAALIQERTMAGLAAAPR